MESRNLQRVYCFLAVDVHPSLLGPVELLPARTADWPLAGCSRVFLAPVAHNRKSSDCLADSLLHLSRL